MPDLVRVAGSYSSPTLCNRKHLRWSLGCGCSEENEEHAYRKRGDGLGGLCRETEDCGKVIMTHKCIILQQEETHNLIRKEVMSNPNFALIEP